MSVRLVRDTLLAACVGLLLGVVFHMVVGADQAAGGTAQPMPRPELAEHLSRSVMKADVVACEVRRQGSVTIIDAPFDEDSSRPTIVTNAHVVQGAASATLSGARLGVTDGRVGPFLDKRDAAVLQAPESVAAESVGLEPAPHPSLGDPVVLAGFPGGTWTIQDGTISSVELRTGWGGSSEVLVIDVPIEQGMSGGVVADLQGNAVGLIAARDPGTGHAVAYPIEDVLNAPVGTTPGC